MNNQYTSLSTVQRFWERVIKKSPDECWIWTGRLNSDGYGAFDHDNTWTFAHRFMWELVNGKVPAGLEICHTCDNRRCVNPNHMWVGTHQENIEDMVKKGRVGDHKGEKNGRAILNFDDAQEVRNLRSSGMSYKDIAEKFGVSVGCVSHIINGRHWIQV